MQRLIAPLQDLLNAQPIVVVQLIAHIWGTALQEDIASAVSRLVQLGSTSEEDIMSIAKRVLNPERLRQVPEHFSWVDHRLRRSTPSRRLTSVPGRSTCFWSPLPMSTA
ncbi:MAG: hypothetical protein IPI02_24390 [Sterolibacteriaceae bacterium]|nr:hypothetical protein [Sterolibacteriaceae bacterium]